MLIQCFDFEWGQWSFEGPVLFEGALFRDEHVHHMLVEYPSRWRMFVKSGTYLNDHTENLWYRSTAIFLYPPEQADITLDLSDRPPDTPLARRLGVRILDCDREQILLREMQTLRQMPYLHLQGLPLPTAQKRMYARSLDYIAYMLERGP